MIRSTVCTLFIVISAYAVDSNALAKFLDYMYEHDQFQGAISISQGETQLFQGNYGYAWMNDSIEIADTTVFKTGSITKMFTSVMLYQLIDEGKVTLETPLSNFYPQIPNAEKITIADMLEHRSGIFNYTSDESFWSEFSSPKTHEFMVSLIAEYEPSFLPREQMEYSNSNYVLLGYIIEELTKSSYSEQLQIRISEPLGLLKTSYGGALDYQKGDAFSYRYYNREWVIAEEWDMSIPHGAGAIVSTTRELSQFITALFNGELLTENSFESMLNSEDSVGRGIWKSEFDGHTLWGHMGGIDAFTSTLIIFPEDSLVISAIANGNKSFWDVTEGVKGICFGNEISYPEYIPFTIEELDLEKDELKEYEGEYTCVEKPEFQLELKIKRGKLHGIQGENEPIELTPFTTRQFRNDPFGIELLFETVDSSITYDQFLLRISGSGDLTYERD